MTQPTQPTHPRRRRVSRLVITLIVLLGLAFAAEVFLRADAGRAGTGALPIMQQIKMQESLGQFTYAPDPTLGALLAPARRDQIEKADFTYTLQTDHAGFPNRDPWPANVDVAVLGNSLIIGPGVGFEGQFTTLLQQQLNGRTVLNLGVPGGGTEHLYRVYRKFGQTRNPKLVIAALWVTWDISNTFHFHEWLAERSTLDYTKYRMTYRQTHRESGQIESGHLARLRTSARGLLGKSYLLRTLNAHIRPALGPQALTESVELPGGDVQYLADREQERLATGFERAGVPNMKEIFFRPLEQLQSEVEAQGGRFVIVLIPCKEELYAAKTYPEVLRAIQEVKGELASRNLATLDLYPLFRQLGATQALFYRLDMHLNEYGNRIVADAIARWIAEEQVFGSTEG